MKTMDIIYKDHGGIVLTVTNYFIQLLFVRAKIVIHFLAIVGVANMKLALVCKICDEITWVKIDNYVMSTQRRFHICIECDEI